MQLTTACRMQQQRCTKKETRQLIQIQIFTAAKKGGMELKSNRSMFLCWEKMSAVFWGAHSRKQNLSFPKKHVLL